MVNHFEMKSNVAKLNGNVLQGSDLHGKHEKGLKTVVI